MLTAQELDTLLATMKAQSTVLTTNLFEFEELDAYKLLNDPQMKGQLTGLTAARVRGALQSYQDLWQSFSLFTDLIERAETLRGTDKKLKSDKLQELEQLLTGRSIKLPAKQIPLAQRGLLTGSETDDSISADDLLRTMSGAFDAAKSVVLEVQAVWDRLLPALSGANQELASLKVLATELGGLDLPELAALTAEIESLRAAVRTDPLSVQAGFDSQVAPKVVQARTRLEQLKRERDSIPADLVRAARLLDEIESLAAQGKAALTLTREKIKDPVGLLEPLADAELSAEPLGLKPWLARLTTLAAGSRWQTARKGIDSWLNKAAGTKSTAAAILAANEAPYQTRAELRGLLEALNAKASELGLREDSELSKLSAQAKTLLYSAPCDLDAASKALTSYGAGLK